MRKKIGNRGSISVFQCLILMVIIIFILTFIDCSRIIIAERQVQEALNTSARSVLAGYDENLINDYGIFALDTTSSINGNKKIKDEFIRYLEVNLKNSDKYNLIKFELMKGSKNTGIEGYGSLLDNQMLKNSMMEYMKYRAPVSVIENLAEQFKNINIKGKIEYTKKEKVVRKARNDLNDAIDNTNEKMNKIKELNNSNDENKLEQMKTLLGEIKNECNNVKDKLDTYKKAKEEADACTVSNNQNSDADIQVTKSNEFDNVELNVNEIEQIVNDGKKEVEIAIAKVEQLKGEIAGLEKSIENLNKQLEVIDENIKGIEAKLEQSDSEEEKEKLSAEEIARLNKSLKEENDKKGKIENEIGVITEQITSKRNEINNIIKNFKLPADKEIVTNKPADNQDGKTEDTGEKDVATDTIDKLSETLKSYLKVIDESWIITRDEINNHVYLDEKKYEKMKQKNSVVDSDMAEIDNDEAGDFLNIFIDALENGRDKLYITEYVMGNFTYLTTNIERDHYFTKGEAEYILWGDRSELSNITKTLGTIWMLRFSINFIDSFVKSCNPEPLFRLIYAVGKAFILSCRDIAALCRGEEIALCPSVKFIKIGYDDHLRLMLLVQSMFDEEGQLNNIRQLIQINCIQKDENFKAGNYNMYIKGYADVKINLWFLPVLHLDKLNIPGFNKGSYIIHKEINLGY